MWARCVPWPAHEKGACSLVSKSKEHGLEDRGNTHAVDANSAACAGTRPEHEKSGFLRLFGIFLNEKILEKILEGALRPNLG